jgi:hypothetical protein
VAAKVANLGNVSLEHSDSTARILHLAFSKIRHVVQEQQNAPVLRLFSDLSTTQVGTQWHDSAEPQQQCRQPCENPAAHGPASLKWNAPALLALSCLSDVVLIGLPISLFNLTRITNNNDRYALKWDEEQDYVGTWFYAEFHQDYNQNFNFDPEHPPGSQYRTCASRCIGLPLIEARSGLGTSVAR